MKYRLIVLLLILLYFNCFLCKLKSFEHKCTATERKGIFCPASDICIAGIEGFDAQGQKVEGCCNPCACCLNPKVEVVKLVDDMIDEEILTVVVNSQYKFVEDCPKQRPYICPMYFMEGLVGVDARGQILNNQCGNNCFCCQDKRIDKIYEKPQDLYQIGEISNIAVVGSQYKFVQKCPISRVLSECPMYIIDGLVGVDAEGNIINNQCGNPCFCCSDKRIVQVLEEIKNNSSSVLDMI